MDSLIPHKLNLSIPQLKKLLKGHAVQLSKELIGSGAGDKEIHLTPTNAKKLMRAYNNSKGMRLTLGPNEVSLSGGNIIKTAKSAGKRLITAGTDRAIRALSGGNIIKTAKSAGKRLITAGTDRAIRAIGGSGVNRLKKAERWEGFANKTIRDGIDTAGKAGRVYKKTMGGFGVNRLKKATRWEGFANKTVRDAIDTAGKAGRVYNKTMGGIGLYGYGMEFKPAVMPRSEPKLGKGVATRSKVYRTAMRRNMGVDIDNASIAKPPGGRYNSAVKPSSNVMTMSPYQGTNSPAMHPFVPMTAYQNSGVSYNIR
jgi:hypothetical protein